VPRTLATGFDDSFRRHLVIEQRRAVLDTIARELRPDTTLGDIVDAAQELGWGDNLGELSLSDLALALLGDAEPAAEAPAEPAAEAPAAAADAEDDEDAAEVEDADEADEDDEAEDEEEEEEEEEEEAVVAAPRRGRAAAEPAKPRKPSSMDRALDRIDKALAARGRKPRAAETRAAKSAKKPAKAAAKKAAKPADDDTEAMSLEQAAKMLVPLVRKLKEATMQDLEEQTGMGRRKLRFHIGQLVKHGRLKRHGMGRGTCYTVR
jgi:hypothetical protein